MKRFIAYYSLLLMLGTTSVFAHRLDEYLQATTFRIESNRVAVKMRLTPGTQVFERFLAIIDTNRDGVISEAEQQEYANLVRHDISLTSDQQALDLQLVSHAFPNLDEMKQGLGEIELDFAATLPQGGNQSRPQL